MNTCTFCDDGNFDLKSFPKMCRHINPFYLDALIITFISRDFGAIMVTLLLLLLLLLLFLYYIFQNPTDSETYFANG